MLSGYCCKGLSDPGGPLLPRKGISRFQSAFATDFASPAFSDQVHFSV